MSVLILFKYKCKKNNSQILTIKGFENNLLNSAIFIFLRLIKKFWPEKHNSVIFSLKLSGIFFKKLSKYVIPPPLLAENAFITICVIFLRKY